MKVKFVFEGMGCEEQKGSMNAYTHIGSVEGAPTELIISKSNRIHPACNTDKYLGVGARRGS